MELKFAIPSIAAIEDCTAIGTSKLGRQPKAANSKGAQTSSLATCIRTAESIRQTVVVFMFPSTRWKPEKCMRDPALARASRENLGSEAP